MIRTLLCVAALVFCGLPTRAADPTCIPACKCGCAETGKCACKSCNEHTADPNWQAAGTTYSDCLTAVQKGTRTTLYVGVWYPPGAYHVDSLKGFSAGIYNCWLEGSTPTFQPILQHPVVAADVFGYSTVGACAGGSCGVGYPILMGGSCAGGSCAGGSCASPARGFFFRR